MKVAVTGDMSASPILERFVVERPLTSGGMGALWLAHELGTEIGAKDVVLKTIRPDLLDDDDVLGSFKREIDVTARLEHAHVVKHVAHGEWDGRDVMALQHIRGVSVADIAHASPRLPVAAVSSIAAEILDALAYVHAVSSDDGVPLGLVHGDVSPQNILVGADGSSTLIDFGAAVTCSDKVPVVIGKAGYLSPEQSRGAHLDAKSDQYSIAVVLWELLTGASLFDGDARRRGRPIPPVSTYCGVPAEIEAAVLRMLSFDGAARFASCSEARAVFEPFADRAWLARAATSCRPRHRDWRDAQTRRLAH